MAGFIENFLKSSHYIVFKGLNQLRDDWDEYFALGDAM
jgi:hypothetical protein